MTHGELRAECERVIAEIGADADVLLVLPGPTRPGRRRLFGRRGPLGKFVGDCERGSLCEFRAKDVLPWIGGDT
jgi:hypothetical protein